MCVSWREDLRFAAETHHRAIPILQFARLAVGNVALQRRSAAGLRASGSMSRRSSSPTLRPGDIVIMDNLGSHKAKAVRQLIRAAGAKLFFLPKYSPDLNPIEQVFAKLKHLLRKAAASQIGEILRAFTPTQRQLFPKLRLCPILKASCFSLRPARARSAVRRRGPLPLRPLRPLRHHQDLGAASCCP